MIKEIEQAKLLIEEENQRVANECSKKIDTILKEMGCELIVVGQFVCNQLQHQIAIKNK